MRLQVPSLTKKTRLDWKTLIYLKPKRRRFADNQRAFAFSIRPIACYSISIVVVAKLFTLLSFKYQKCANIASTVMTITKEFDFIKLSASAIQSKY